MRINTTLKFGIIALVLAVASLLIAFVLGAIDSETLKNSGVKAAAVIGILALAFIAISAVASNGKE